MIADSLSRRDKIIQIEWSLHQQIFNQICKVWHTPMVDLFATHLNHKLPIYVSPVPYKKAWKIDALNICWGGLDGYVFCPVAILPQVIKKIITIQDDCTGPRVARDAMGLGSGGFLDHGNPTAPSLEDTNETTTFQQVPQQRGFPEST